MKTDSDKLNDDLLDEVQNSPNEDGNDDLVNNTFPFPGRLITVKVVAFHGRQERNFDCKPPEEKGSGNFELLSKVPPFLGIVCKKARDHPHGPRNHFSYDLGSFVSDGGHGSGIESHS